jgi:hypothetical protein
LEDLDVDGRKIQSDFVKVWAEFIWLLRTEISGGLL